MFEIILDSIASIIEAQVELQNIVQLLETPDYKPMVMSIELLEVKKTRRQMSAIRAMIQELWNSNMHSCPIEKASLEVFTDYIKKDVIKLLIIKEKWDSRNKVIIKRYEAKSMADYTKAEMIQAITNVLTYVDLCGCNSPKMEQIRAGMERDKIGTRLINKEE